ncbi:MAG TPA: class I SAM-dependent methyltransferase [Clostridia bacterium]|jgi:23S rRNA (cytosine1962-C5)-methyltransferase|nr:MAG: Ribosomal RNA large subunit methyltransferase K [Firmicutes bacterium ADurb.Bin248]HOG00648.1 class I SAM-dependent methyltransferase [Clostridia bacterium]HOS18577.1 class I SAM-dependent methyltransferase [Clostridia bacterium]HPK15823.1 class I SAM-dependent methyltransferase [Clostridia bacterium]
MYISDKWQDYELLDAGGGNKLERWGDVVLLRPDPQAIWPMGEGAAERADAVYIRSATGGGHWEFKKKLPESWRVRYGELSFIVRPTGFKHTGLFPEQAVNWDWMGEIARGAGRRLRVLNLFAYTGGATAALAASGAEVVHVDAARGMVAWAKDNLAASGLSEKPARFIVDDAMKFALREERRGRTYDGILMDPPSYGRGPTGEMWKIEDDLYALVAACARLLCGDARFFLINSYTTGLAPSVLRDILEVALKGRGGRAEADEVGLPISRDGLVLPCGASGRWVGGAGRCGV